MTAKVLDLAHANTLPKVLAFNAAHFGSDVALREKKLGIWEAWTWGEYHRQVGRIACGLKALGVGRGDVVGLIGDNRPHWVAGEIATHAVGAISLGLYRDLLETELSYLATFAGIKVILAEDEEQVDKCLALGGALNTVAHIIYDDPRGMRKYQDPRLVALADLKAAGDQVLAADPKAYERLVEATCGDAVAIYCTTSGTTSHPKLAVLSAERLLRHCQNYLLADPKGPRDEYVSVLPLPWIMEQVYALGKSLIARMKVNFVEEPETTMADLREIGPTFLLLAPRVWEGIAADVRARMMDASWLKRLAFDAFSRLGLKAQQRGRHSRLAEWFLFRALRDRLGFSHLRSAATGGAALGPDTFRFFLSMGVPLRQLYGQTELLGAYTIHTHDDIDFDTVGVPFCSDIQLRIENPGEDGIGEIICSHPNAFLGYLNNDTATAESWREGWMHTGDAGYLDPKGHLVVVDRLADLARMADGKRFSPQFLENKLKFSPFVGEAVILGAGRDYIATMVCIRYATVAKWAEKNRINFTTYTDLAAKTPVYQLIQGEIQEVNASLPQALQIRKFLLLYKELDPDDGELTRTRKVRRGIIGDKYRDLIDAIYGDETKVAVDTTITFQDGSTQRIQTTLNIVTLESPPQRESRADPVPAAAAG
ncbi:MAG: AMP-binding protein [Candidatus Competibacterales bacterium]